MFIQIKADVPYSFVYTYAYMPKICLVFQILPSSFNVHLFIGINKDGKIQPYIWMTVLSYPYFYTHFQNLNFFQLHTIIQLTWDYVIWNSFKLSIEPRTKDNREIFYLSLILTLFYFVYLFSLHFHLLLSNSKPSAKFEVPIGRKNSYYFAMTI